MTKAVFVVMTNVQTPEQEADFNEWYDTVHLADVLQTPGVVKATRYRLAAGRPKEGRGQYLALYEVETADPTAILAQIQETLRRREAEGSQSLHEALVLVTQGIYEQLGEPQVARAPGSR